MFDYFDPKTIADNMRILIGWLAKLDSFNEKSTDIITINFLLYKKDCVCDNMSPYEFYIYGTKNYSPRDDEWASEEAFSPSRLSVSPTLWLPAHYTEMFALHYMRTLLYHTANAMRHLSLLRVYHITVSYPTGVLLRVREMGHTAMNDIREELFDFNL